MLKRVLSFFAVGCMLLSFLPIHKVCAAERTVISESYTEGFTAEDLAAIGWRAEESMYVNPGSTTMTADGEGLHIKKGWSNSAGSWQPAYKAYRTFNSAADIRLLSFAAATPKTSLQR